MEKKYAKAYTEVLEILKHVPKEELDRIPKSELQFYEDNCDKNYKYEYNEELNVDQQAISREANTVIVAIYMNYFANDKQKGIIESILKQNSIEEEKQKNEKYNIDKIFDNKEKHEDAEHDAEKLPVDVDKKEEIFIKKIINRIKKLFKRN
ncbi:MAG: hypothetical protein IJH12_04180 [Clostridia bacterium]|nr:hypothetical protein [Clostridia bacterium]